jgi:hypothetical protein
MARSLVAAALAAAAFLITGCGLSSREPRSATGVRSAYTAIDADAATGNFYDLCRRYLDRDLLRELASEHKECATFMSEHWGEFTPAAKVDPSTRVAVDGTLARVYDGSPPEVVEYANGAWRLTGIPRSGERGTSFIRKLNREAEALNRAAERGVSG